MSKAVTDRALRAHRNHLLASLDEPDQSTLSAFLRPVSLVARQIIYEPGETSSDLFFLESGLASLIRCMDNQPGLEVALLGRETVMGMEASGLSGMPAEATCVVQVASRALQLRASLIPKVMEELPAFAEMMRHAAFCQLNAAHLSILCNSRHTVTQRLARWLAMVFDRVDGSRLTMTQESIASLLGVHRVAVSLAAGDLQASGLIQYTRGQITMLDHKGLVAATCDCYRPPKG